MRSAGRRRDVFVVLLLRVSPSLSARKGLEELSSVG